MDLLDWADVVTESFSPKAIALMGLRLRADAQDEPDIIMLSHV